MDDDQQALGRARIAELLLALQEAFQKLDQLEKRIAEKKPSVSAADRETNPIAALLAAPVATVVSSRAEGCPRTTKGLRTSDGGPGSVGEAWSSRVGRWRGDRDRVCGRGSDADHRRGRRGDAEGSGRGAG